MQVPQRFLRRAWHIILENFESNIKYYEGLLDEDLTSIKNVITRDPLTKDTIRFEDADEYNWVHTGISFVGAEKTSLVYPFMPIIRHGLYPQVCGIIELAIRNLDAGDDTDIKKEDYADRNNSRFTQNILNNKLSHKTTKRKGEYTFKKESIDMELDFALAIISLAEAVINDKSRLFDSDNSDLKWMSHFKELLKVENNHQLLDRQQSALDPYRSLVERRQRLWASTIGLKKFNNTKWLCFLRTDGCNTESDLSVSISPVVINYQGKKSGMTVQMASQYINTNGELENFDYKGLIAHDRAANYLIAELVRESENEDTPETFAYFVMQLANDANQTLSIGHYTYYSLNSQRYITKSAIWLKVDKDFPAPLIEAYSDKPFIIENFMSYAYDVNPINDKEAFNTIPLVIRRYLASRVLNRLTLPEERIGHLKATDLSLANWMEKVNKFSEDQRLKDCCTNYYVLYYYGNEIDEKTTDEEILNQVRTDSLDLSFDENYIEYRASYVHERTPDIVYKGTVGRRNNTLEVLVENKKEGKLKTFNTNIVTINFSIPVFEESLFREEYDKVNYLEGIINGLNDNDLTPISFVALVVKKQFDAENKPVFPFQKKNVHIASSIDVASYFRNNSYQLRIETAYNPILTYESVILLATEKGYACFEDDNNNLVIRDFKKVCHQIPIDRNMEYTVLQQAEVIKRLPHLRLKKRY